MCCATCPRMLAIYQFNVPMGLADHRFEIGSPSEWEFDIFNMEVGGGVFQADTSQWDLNLFISKIFFFCGWVFGGGAV